jgi:putative FmdB family regulatory protein
MPLFEYVCRDCQRRFEALVRPSAEPECPTCKGKDLSRLLSTFAVGGRGATLAKREPAGPCGTCGDPRGPGSCALDR